MNLATVEKNRAWAETLEEGLIPRTRSCVRPICQRPRSRGEPSRRRTSPLRGRRRLERVARLREWTQDREPDEPLFPRLDRKKTGLMAQKDVARIGIPYETPEGIADFHAAGRHSHFTGLVRHGATLVEAKELARHAEVRQTRKSTQIGLDDQAQAPAGLPAPFASAVRDGLQSGRISGGVLSQELSPGDTARATSNQPGKEQTPAAPWFTSSPVGGVRAVGARRPRSTIGAQHPTSSRASTRR